MFKRILIANRGEIACRIIKTARRMGIATVAVYSDADRDALHVSMADLAVPIGPAPAGESYLVIERIVAACRSTGAEAVHPGYGFLSERAEFAQALASAGIAFIGPNPAAIAAMGDKIESKKAAARAGVSTVPGHLGVIDDDRQAVEIATSIGFPVMIKASAGGGGKGMRIANSAAEVAEGFERARSEARASFGDERVFIEKFIENPRHVEIQVLGDKHGNIIHLGERECSIQRRNQKVLEEAPSPLLDEATRRKMGEQAVALAKAVGYDSAGTVEFVAGQDRSFYFLEMNTRLQVEHPVTECTTGLDLVDLQLHIAAGGRLDPEPPAVRGHSIEVRLYAEDPARDWQPQSGTVHRLALPTAPAEFAVLRETGVRLDSGVVDGTEVGVHYDPMLAKVVSRAPTRAVAARLLAATLASAEVHGVRTNRDLLVNVLRHPAFLAGDTDTAFFDTHGLDVLSAPLADRQAEAVSALAAALADAAHRRATASVNAGLPGGWRNLPSQPQVKTFTGDLGEHEVRYRLGRTGLDTAGFDIGFETVVLLDLRPDRVVLELDGLRREFRVARYADAVHVDSGLGPVRLREVPRFTDPSTQVAAGSLLAPMPGAVIRLGAEVGDTVTAGQPILWLDAMKMEHTITAPTSGVLTELNVTVGAQVAVGALLAVVTEPDAHTVEGEQA